MQFINIRARSVQSIIAKGFDMILCSDIFVTTAQIKVTAKAGHGGNILTDSQRLPLKSNTIAR